MLSNLNEFRKIHPDAKVYVTGHSLGGAMATLAVAAIFNSTGIKVDKFYTIGSPRVGDKNFSEWWKKAAIP